MPTKPSTTPTRSVTQGAAGGPCLDRITPMLIDDIGEVLRLHHPNPPATEAELAEFERAHGFRLDPELRAFYAAMNGGQLFRKVDPPYRFLPLAQIVTGKEAMLPPTTKQICPDNVFAFCESEDACYVAFEVMPGELFPIHILYESWPQEIRVIATSFAEFLHRALTEGGEYWIG